MAAFAVVAGAPDVVYAAAGGGTGSLCLIWRREGRGLLLWLRFLSILIATGLGRLGLVQRENACGWVQKGQWACDVFCRIVPATEVSGGAV